MISNQDALAAAVLLMADTDLYQQHTIADIKRTFFPPIQLGQCQVYFKDGSPTAFVSWAYLTPEARDGFLDRTRKLQPEDWNAGDELWFINFICPYGGVRAIVRDLYKLHPNAKAGHTARTYGTSKVKRTGIFRHAKKDVV